MQTVPIEDDKRDLINREIGKFRKTAEADEQKKEKEKDRKKREEEKKEKKALAASASRRRSRSRERSKVRVSQVNNGANVASGLMCLGNIMLGNWVGLLA